MSERAGLSDYILLSVEVVSSQGRSGSNFLHHLCYKPSGWLRAAALRGWVREDRRRAAGAAPVCCGATPVDEFLHQQPCKWSHDRLVKGWLGAQVCEQQLCMEC